MGIYTEKRDQLIEKIKGLEKRIASDTAKKKTLEDKLKEVSRLAMAEEYNCKPRELDEIITSEHSLLQKLRANGLSDEELLKLVGSGNAENEKHLSGIQRRRRDYGRAERTGNAYRLEERFRYS